MRHNQVVDYVSVAAGDMSQATITGNQTNINNFDVASYFFSWTGGQTTNGTLGIEVSMDGTNFSLLDFGATINADGVSGNHRLVITEVCFKFARPKYTKVNGSASGSMKIEMFATIRGA